MIAIRQAVVTPESIHAYRQASAAFVVAAQLVCEPIDGGLGGIALCEAPVAAPYAKGAYDDHLADWAQRYDTRDWGIFLAWHGDESVGAAAVAPPQPDMVAARGRTDVAVLWDLRVAGPYRGRGVGAALFRACATWARDRGYRRMALETQNVNVAACRLYARMGCELTVIDRVAYAACPEVAHEAMLIWELVL